MAEDGFDLKKLQLEVGGNVFELIEFELMRRQKDGQPYKGSYGVNVAKVREVVRLPPLAPVSSNLKGIVGLFELRGVPIPAVDLKVALGDEPTPLYPQQKVLVTEFSQKRAGFIVDSAKKIRRIGWDKVLPPVTPKSSCLTGMTLLKSSEFLFIIDLERVLLTLEFGDFESNLGSVGPVSVVPAPALTAVDGALSAQPSAATLGPLILLVDDAAFIRTGVRQMLERSYYRVIEATDGEEALTILADCQRSGQGIDLIISDVEMPRLDGLGLTKKVRDHDDFAAIPILLHTSLSGKANQVAGLSVGANGYVVKNDFKSLFRMIHELLGPSVGAIPQGSVA